MRVLVLVALLAGCGGGGERVVVGSKNFTEQRILGELLAQTVERVGLRAERRLDLGGTFVCNAAIRAGQIDAYVEYTGTALTAVLKQPPESDPGRVLARVRDAYAAAGLVWTAPLGFDNTFALVIRGDEPGVRTISDAVPRARDWRAAFGYEFKERADGYPGLERVYGLRFKEIRIMDQEATLPEGGPPVVVPVYLKEVLAELTRQLRHSPQVNQRSGVSVRYSIGNLETVAASARIGIQP